MKLQVLFIMAIVLPSVILSNTFQTPDLQLEPSYFTPQKKPQQVNYEQVQNTKYFESKDNQPAESFELEDKLLEGSDEYGYGYWLRFQEGEEQDIEKYYFLSRLTTNKDFADFTYYGDRTLSVFLYKSVFVYATYDLDENLKSKERPVKLSENINGNWYFVCYTKMENNIVGFLVKFGAQFMIRFEQYGRHKPSRYYKVLFGGQQFQYLQFPGQFANIFFDFDGPIFANSNQDVLKLIQKHCNMPQILVKNSSFKLITVPSNFNANNKDDSQEMEPFKTQYIITQYQIKGWIRWIDDIQVQELNSFQIFNLRSNQKKQNKTGDRALEIQQIVGGGAESFIYFSTYSIIDEQQSIVQQIKSYQYVWTYAQFSYDIAKLKAFGYLIYPGFSQSVSFEEVQHKQVQQLFLTIGADEYISSFNGKIAHVTFNVGPRTYSEQIVIDEDGANFLYLREMQVSQLDEITESKYNSIQPVFQQIYDDEKVNGQSEYSFGMWSRWIRTYPTYLQKRSEIHSIAHLKRQYKQILLEIQLSKSSYMFESLQEIKNMDFEDKLEGCWNYLYFGYDRLKQLALGAVNFNGNELKTVEFKTSHELILDVIEFIVGKHNTPAFNGEFARIIFQFGPYSFKQINQLNEISIQGLPFMVTQQQETIQLIGALYKTPIDEKFEFTQYQGIKEYSVSGWVKFSGKEKSGEQFHLITLTQRKLDELSNQVTFEIIKNDISYVFTTYSCSQDCDKQINTESKFGEYWDQWTYIYFGYKPSQAYSYLQYTFTSDSQKMYDIQHYYMAVFSILLGQQRKEYNEFTGAMKQWVVNVGEGAYREGGFENEQQKIHFGYIAGTDHFKQASQIKDHPDLLDCQTQLIQFQQSETLQLDGIHEYGYGLWIQFRHYANTITLLKPKLMGIARLYINQVEHLLSVVMNVGNYQFITLDNNINQGYDQYHNGEWIFLYYSYKRLEHTYGQAKGFIYDYNGWKQIVQYVVHPLIRDHLNFQVGSASKNYPQFSGLITGIRIYIGNGALVDDLQVQQMINKINPKPKQQFIDNEVEILEERTNKIKDQNPLQFEGESNQYSIQLWFKINPNSFLYRFTQNENPLDQKYIGDRTLHLQINDKNVEYSSYSLLVDDQFITSQSLQCQITAYHNDLWAFTYQAYSKVEKKMKIYLLIEEQQCEKNIEIINTISDKYWLYLLQDYNGNAANIMISDVRVTLGQGSFTNNYSKLPSYISGLKLIPKIIEEIDLIEETQQFKYTEIESMTEYSISFWWKFSSTYPQRLYKKNENIQIFRMTTNQEETEGVIELGDRLLSAFIVQNGISFNSYDLNDNAPNEYTIISIKRLENRWYFIYAGYKRKLQLAKFEIFDGQEYKQSLNENLLQKPLNDYLGIIVGQQNILLTQITTQVGSGSFGQTGAFIESKLQEYIVQYQLPDELTLENAYHKKHGVIELEDELNEHDFLNVGSYAVCGWFKLNYKPDAKYSQEQSCVTLIRLYENEKLNDKLLQGDRTLLIQVCDQQFVKFQTYTLNEIQSINEHKLIEEQFLLDSAEIWHYVYFGYDDLKEEVSILLHQFDSDETKIINKIWHMQTNYLGMLFGKEIDGKTFDGTLKDWQFLFGYNSYIDKSDKMPNIEKIKNNQKYFWRQTEDIHEFDNGVKEYAIGVWTRQLSEFYDCKQISFHSIFRFVNRKNYEDRNQYGDRILYTYLTSKNYEFSSYDKKQKQISINMQIPYEFIEGDWNYIYFAYKNKNLYAAIIHNSDKTIEHRQMSDIEHDILGYSQLITRKPEFGLQDFKGELYDLRVYLGEGSYIDDSQKLISMVNKYHQKLPVNEIVIDQFKWDITQFDSQQDEIQSFQYDFDIQMQTQYQIFGWIYMHNKQELDSLQGIMKLTTNLNLNTLLLLGKSDTLTFGTYSIGKKVQPIWQSIDINTEEWMFVQLAYADDNTYFIIHKIDGVTQFKFRSRHVVPQHFQLQLCKFDSFADFNGIMKEVQILWNQNIDNDQHILVHQ